MKSSIFIPKKINVGYQNRQGTYTGKLAYVIYTDEKGKLRKENSWNSWRDITIEPDVFDNTPTEGFVLNKKVGDYDSGWNHRHAYCRIYDPRGFEFEITFENLLYILENTNSIVGKGLEGLFVYGWDGKDLVLIPTSSPDYKEISKYNEIVHNNLTIKAKDLIVGATYLGKDNKEYIYMGRYDYYSYGYRWIENGEYKTGKHAGIDYRQAETIDCPYGKHHWFAYKYYGYSWVGDERKQNNEYEWAFIQTKNVSGFKLMTCIDEKCVSYYADIYEVMIRRKDYSPRMIDDVKYIPYSFEEFNTAIHLTEYNRWQKKDELYDKYFFSENGLKYTARYLKSKNLWEIVPYDWWRSNKDYEKVTKDYYNRFDFDEIEEKTYWGTTSVKKEFIPITTEELYKKLKPHYSEVYLENGFLYERRCYYGDKE